ncbi:hypothetical protein [Methanospirillum lacunae]|nr:hypothetical protein [Methanospirillum lacunae]
MDSIPEEVKPLNGLSNTSFLLMYLHVQLIENVVDEANCTMELTLDIS